MTTANEGMLTLLMALKVMSAAQIKLGRLTSNCWPLAKIMSEEVILATWVLKVFKRLLLSIWIVATVSKLMPSRDDRKVLETMTLFAELTTAGKVSEESAGKATQSMEPTEVKAFIPRVEIKVKPFNPKVPPMEPIVVLLNSVRVVALLQIRSPVIC